MGKELLILLMAAIFLFSFAAWQFFPLSISNENGTSISLAGRQVYSIMSGHNSPDIYRAEIDPVDVKVGDAQAMTVWVREEDDPIISVVANVETDTGIEVYELSLASGDALDGEWGASWVVHDTHSETYRTEFVATNDIGETKSVTLTWTDPCTPPAGGDWTLDGSCSISGVNGVDNGNFIINNAAYTLTLQVGATFAWNDGKSITLTAGSIAISDTAQLKQTNLWMVDGDSDGYPSTATQYAQAAAPSQGRRRYLMSSVSSTDCYDSNANAKPGQTQYFSAHRGDGSYDYNCDGSQGKNVNTCNTCTVCTLSDLGGCASCPSGYNQINYDCTTTRNCGQTATNYLCRGTTPSGLCPAGSGSVEYTEDGGTESFCIVGLALGNAQFISKGSQSCTCR